MKRQLAALAFALLLPVAHADAKGGAIAAAVEDCVTTGTAFAFGFVEGNPVLAMPLGPVLACALKPALIASVQDQPEPTRTQSLHAIHAAWTGAAVNNVMALVGAGAGAPVFGVMVAIGLWAAGEREREFARLCAVHRQLAGNAALACAIEQT